MVVYKAKSGRWCRSTPEDGTRARAANGARLFGADDREGAAHEDVMRPADGDHVDVVLAVAQQHHTVDGAPWVGCQRSGFRLIRRRSGDDRSRPRLEAHRDLTNDRRWAWLPAL